MMRLQLTCLLDMARKRTPCSLIRCFPAPGERYGSRSHEVLDIREPTDAILLTPVLVTQADTKHVGVQTHEYIRKAV
jgi:hypothetical protein